MYIHWNPWHGCIKVSEGCKNCYMYHLDEVRGKNGGEIYKVKNNFNLPLKKDKAGEYKIKSNDEVRVCMTSDFFLEEADEWRNDIWKIIREREDVFFIILTKRADRIRNCLPSDWGNGYDNVMLEVTAENQKRADERIPILLDLPSKYKGVVVAPILENINIEEYLKSSQIDRVSVAGENYTNSRICNFNWILSLHSQCIKYDVSFNFFETGSRFVKDGKLYNISKNIQSSQAKKSNLNYKMEMPLFTYEENNLFSFMK